MLTLRLARVGKKKQAFYKLIVSEKTRDTRGTYLEALGNLNPHTNPSTLVVNKERIEHWLKQGATMSATVNNLLVDRKIIKGEKVKAWKPKKKEIVNPPAGGPAPATAPAKPAEARKEEAKPAPVEAPKGAEKPVEPAKEEPNPPASGETKPTEATAEAK